MIISNTGCYQVISENLQAFASPSFKKPTGEIYPISSFITLIKFQENIPGVAEWGQMNNGKWITTLQNRKMRVKFVNPATPAEITSPEHSIEINEMGMISIDGLPYE